jgi:hypothetical protein
MNFTNKFLKTIIKYDPNTGYFYWIDKRINKDDTKVIGHNYKDGPITIGIAFKKYPAHRLAWLYMTGEWPPYKHDVKHKDGNLQNNAWNNLYLKKRTSNH